MLRISRLLVESHLQYYQVYQDMDQEMGYLDESMNRTFSSGSCSSFDINRLCVFIQGRISASKLFGSLIIMATMTRKLAFERLNIHL